MKNSFGYKIDIPHALVAFGVCLTAFVVYALTKAPTLSFWDCGEFIAASYILGIPHPPGSPLYILVGRIFSVLPLSSDIAVRVNYLSVFSSSFTALFGYLVATRILRAWFGSDRSKLTRGLIYAGGASGALFLAFGLTNWINSVEAEVYGLAMMLMVAMLWLTLVYAEKQGSSAAQRIMLLVVYLGFLGIGVHMTTFVLVPIAALFFIIKKKAGAKAWFAMTIFLVFELYLVFALSSRPGEVPYYFPIVIVLLFYLFYIFSFERIPGRLILVGGGFILASAPLLVTVVNSLWGSNSRQVLGESAVQTLGTVGKAAFGVLILFALYSLYKYFSGEKKKQQKSRHLIYSSFILAAAVLTVVLYAPKGYTTFLAATGIAAAILLFWLRRSVNWPVLIAIAGASLVVIGVISFFYGILISAAAILALVPLLKTPGWRTALMILFCTVAGYSAHLFVPIRSAQQPAINENNPSSSLATTINFLERKQYGSQSMIERMFKRRSEWENQFGDYQRMGFWRFFNEQYGLIGSKFVVLFLLGLFGIWEVIRRRSDVGLSFLVLLLICSVGLILYMNFADGTRQHPLSGADHIEVRDRDYFFTSAFIFFGLAIGIGAAIAVQYIREGVAKFSAIPKKIIVTSSLILFLLPTFTLARNYHLCDRSRSYFPYDYGWNLLTSADPDAVLFTYGDNDTFPLWCMQEVYGVRTDVKVVNLSLSNSKWYIKQLKSSMGLDLGLSNEEIDRLTPYRTAEGTIFRLQDQVIDALIANDGRKIPINFSVSVGLGAQKYRGQPMDSLLVLSGMVWRVDDPGQPRRVEIESSVDFFTNPDKFQCRGVNDPSIYKDATTFRLTRNWANGFLMVADALRKAGDYERAEHLVERALEQIPYSSRAVEYLANLYSRRGKVDELRTLIERAAHGDKGRLKLLLGRSERKLKQYSEAERLFKDVLAEDPSNRSAFEELVRLYLETKQATPLRLLLLRWLQSNPDDNQVKMMLEELEKRMTVPDTVEVNES